MGIFSNLFGAPSPQQGTSAYAQSLPAAQMAGVTMKPSLSNILAMVGAGLKDVGGNGSNNVAATQQMIMGRQLAAQQMAARMALAGLATPGVSTQAPAAPVPQASDPVNLFQGGLFGKAPTQTFGGNSANVVAPSIATPEAAAPALLRAQALGIDAEPYLKVLQAAEPSMQVYNGVAYNPHDVKAGQRIGVSLQSVNNRLIDTQNPDNANLTIPQVDKGQVVNYDARGVPIGVANLPGNAQSQADVAGAVAGAQETAKAGLDMVSVPQPNGSTVMMPRLAAAARLTAAGMPGLGVSQTPGDKSYSEDTSKAQADQYQKLQTAGQQAPLRIAKLNQINSLLGDFEGGKLAPMGVEIASALNGLGIKVDKNLGNQQAAQSLSNQMALELRDPSQGGGMPGSMSNSDREFLTKMVPGLMQSATGRRQLVGMNVAMQQRNADVANLARQWTKSAGRLDKADRNGKDFYDYLQGWSAQHPLFTGQ